ncbi:MAG: hypothetical protein ACFFAN_03370 [Promethearchaeota archaeon]
MLTESKRLNIAIILFAIICIWNIYWGTLYAISGTLMPYHQRAIGMTPSQVSNYNPRLMLLISFLFRMEGISIICTSITNLLILNYSFRNKEKWSWIALVVPGLIWYISMFFALYIVLGPLESSLWIHILMATLLIIAAGISYKEFFPKSKKAI